MIAALVWLGIFPQPIFNTFRPAMSYMESSVVVVRSTPPRPPRARPVVVHGVEDARR